MGRTPYHGKPTDIAAADLAREIGIAGVTLRNELHRRHGKLPDPHAYTWHVPKPEADDLRRKFGGTY